MAAPFQSWLRRLGSAPLSAVFSLALALRACQAALLSTYAAPDEYWQGPEIAHKLVFGTGYVTWEWWPAHELRSALHPFLLAVPLFLVRQMGVDTWWLVALLPKLQHAVLTAVTDVATLVLARELFHSDEIAAAALCSQWASWFVMFGALRPFANSLEMALCTVALCLWYRFHGCIATRATPPIATLVSLGVSSVLMGVSIASRPSAAVMWITLGALTIARFGLARTITRTLPVCVPGAALGFALCAVIDRWFYGHWVFPLTSFIRFNIVDGLDALYGTYPVYWYLVDGIPATTGAQLPFLLAGVILCIPAASSVWRRAAGRGTTTATLASDDSSSKWDAVPSIFLLRRLALHLANLFGALLQLSLPLQLEPAVIAAVVVSALSLLAAHKEHRFLLPIIPIFSLYCGRALWACACDSIVASADADVAAVHGLHRGEGAEAFIRSRNRTDAALSGAALAAAAHPTSAHDDEGKPRRVRSRTAERRVQRSSSKGVASVLLTDEPQAPTSEPQLRHGGIGSASVSTSAPLRRRRKAPPSGIDVSSSMTSDSVQFIHLDTEEAGHTTQVKPRSRANKRSPAHSSTTVAVAADSAATSPALTDELHPLTLWWRSLVRSAWVRSRVFSVTITAVFVSSAVLSGYINTVHQAGGVSAARYLAAEASAAATFGAVHAPWFDASSGSGGVAHGMSSSDAAAEPSVDTPGGSNEPAASVPAAIDHDRVESARLREARRKALLVLRQKRQTERLLRRHVASLVSFNSVGSPPSEEAAVESEDEDDAAILLDLDGAVAPSLLPYEHDEAIYAEADAWSTTSISAAVAAAVWETIVPQQALMAVHFLTPCHSTPFYSVVHAPIAMLQLDCSPPSKANAAPAHAVGVHADADRGSEAPLQGTTSRNASAPLLSWPLISESAAWLADPASLLGALYGPAQEQPLACEYHAAHAAREILWPLPRGRRTAASNHSDSAAAAAADATAAADEALSGSTPPSEFFERLRWSTRLPLLSGGGSAAHVHLHMFPSIVSQCEEGHVNHPDESTFATTAAGFLSVFGNPALRIEPSARDFRQLPTHIVMFDVDARKPAVRAFLRVHGYGEAASFFYAHVRGDVHSGRTEEPSRVLVFHHACWAALVMGRGGP